MTLKKIDDDVISINYDVILIFPIYGQFGVIWKPDSGFCLTKGGEKNKTKYSLTQLSFYCLEKTHYLCLK